MHFQTKEANRDELPRTRRTARLTCVDVRGVAHRVELVEQQSGLFGPLARMGIAITRKPDPQSEEQPSA
jgi:hypothetical protein